VLLLAAAGRAGAQTPTIDFDRQVHPILAERCGICHSQEKRSGGLALATYADTLNGGRSGAAVRPGDSAHSLLIRRVTGETAPRMPLGGEPLAPGEIATLRAWIDEGARATPGSAAARPKWEAPLTLERPALPAVRWKNWTAPIDRFAADYMAAHGIAEPPAVSDAAFARRAWLDTQGLLPPPGALRAFLRDAAADKRERLIATLLAGNRQYAAHWISFWNDLLRNDEGVNYFSETASRKSITGWLLNALETNEPYDRFVRQLLDPTGPGDPDGFLIGVNWRGAVSASQTPAMQAAQNTAQIFLGINLKCNSCHDSFISKWKLKDAYALAGYFSAEPKLRLYRCDIAQDDYSAAGFLYPELNRPIASDALADRRAAVAGIFTDPRNGRLARTLVDRIWQRLMGRGIVADPDDMDGEPFSPQLLDWLAADFRDHGYDIKRLIAAIATSRAYQAPAVPRSGEPAGEYVFRGPEVRRITAEQFADAIGAITGDWHVYEPPMPPLRPGATALPEPSPGVYTREWRVAASPLTRALGRPIRDQVFSTRETEATTLQALELVNGETLTHWLLRGARKMLGELPPEPAAVFDRWYIGKGARPEFDIDVSGAKRVWLLARDAGTYSPEKIEAIWAGAEFSGPDGAAPLTSLKPVDGAALREAAGDPADGVRVKFPSVIAYDIAGKGFTHLRGQAGIENREITSDLNPRLRFFIFLEQPDMERLTAVAPETPVPAGPELHTAAEAVDRVFRYALGRAPSADERSAAIAAVGAAKPSAAGLADLLWAVMMKPEFQLIY
jgi:hypothetical protein